MIWHVCHNNGEDIYVYHQEAYGEYVHLIPPSHICLGCSLIESMCPVPHVNIPEDYDVTRQANPRVCNLTQEYVLNFTHVYLGMGDKAP